MSDDEGQVCGCIFLIGTLFGIYEIIKWLVSLYTWEPVAAGIGIIIMTVATMVGYDNMRESLSSHSPSEKGKAFVKFGMIWSISVFIISILVDILYTSVLNKSGERGIGIFLITIFVNMTGTAILFYIGGRELKSCIIEDKKVEGRTITYFGIFWCLFWTILPIALTASKIIVGEGFVSASFLFIAIPGMIVDIIIGKWVSRVDVKKEWEYLSDAQKELNL